MSAWRETECHPGRPHYARGLCARCYSRAYDNGRLEDFARTFVPSDVPCPCGEPGFTRGLCQRHYTWWSHRTRRRDSAWLPNVNHRVTLTEAARYDRNGPVTTVCGMRVFPLSEAADMDPCPACEVALRASNTSPALPGGPGSAGPEVAPPSADGPAGPHRRVEVGR